MTKMNIQKLKENVIKFDAKEISDIPPYFWHYIGFNGRNEDKVNFLIRMIRRIWQKK